MTRSKATHLIPLIFLMAWPAAGVAQTVPADLLGAVRALRNDSATGRITVFYPAAFRERALAARDLVAEGLTFHADSLGAAPTLWLAVLTRAQWDAAITWQPYGIPGVAGDPAVAFLPATDDNMAANDALDLKPHVSAATIAKLRSAGYSYDEAARAYVELVGLHELGHTFTRAYGIRAPSKWMGELLATYFAYSFLRVRHPQRATLWDGILDAYVDAVRPEHRTLTDFERLYFGVGPRNYIWYQSRFQQMVEIAHEQLGLDFLRRVRTLFPANEAVAPAPEETLRRLDLIVPGFATWAATMR